MPPLERAAGAAALVATWVPSDQLADVAAAGWRRRPRLRPPSRSSPAATRASRKRETSRASGLPLPGPPPPPRAPRGITVPSLVRRARGAAAPARPTRRARSGPPQLHPSSRAAAGRPAAIAAMAPAREGTSPPAARRPRTSRRRCSPDPRAGRRARSNSSSRSSSSTSTHGYVAASSCPSAITSWIGALLPPAHLAGDFCSYTEPRAGNALRSERSRRRARQASGDGVLDALRDAARAARCACAATELTIEGDGRQRRRRPRGRRRARRAGRGRARDRPGHRRRRRRRARPGRGHPRGLHRRCPDPPRQADRTALDRPEALRRGDPQNSLAFVIGPAGTGKTYLAVAMAVAALDERRVTRSSCPARRWRPARNSASCPATCSTRWTPTCARSTTRCTT